MRVAHESRKAAVLLPMAELVGGIREGWRVWCLRAAELERRRFELLQRDGEHTCHQQRLVRVGGSDSMAERHSSI